MSDRGGADQPEHGEPIGYWNEDGHWVDEHGYVHDEHGNIFNPDGTPYEDGADDGVATAAYRGGEPTHAEPGGSLVAEHSGHPDDEWSDSPLATARPSTRRTRRARSESRGPRRLLVLLLAIGLVAGAGVVGWSVLKPLLNRPTVDASDFPGPGTDAVTFTVNQGDSGRIIATNLEKAGIVRTAQAFVEVANADSRAAGIQPGDYALKKQMRAADVLAVLVDPKNRQNPKVTIREGLWAKEIYAALSKATGRPIADYEAAAKDPALGLPASAKGQIEGYLFPATYEFSSKDTALAQLQTMVKKTVGILAANGVSEATMERTMIVASIIEAEVNRAEDRPKVARVIENRLVKPMRLQMDSTVNYGTGEHNLTTTDAERAQVNKWNTYTKDGLPETPIGNPGEASIKAAINPPAGPWLYFVATNPEFGETKFATTLTEHNKNVAEFQNWCNRAENAGKCGR